MNYKNPLYSFKYILLFGIIFLMFHCKSSYHLQNISYPKNQSINDELIENQEVVAFIQPYKQKLDNQMNQVIAISSTDLTDQGLSSNLGNLLADVILKNANEFAVENNLPKVDFVVLNHGGMRVDIGKGEVTLNKIFEMMPFENVLVLVTLNGKQLKNLTDYMLKSKKGHPLSGISLAYENEQLTQALINGEPIDENRDYIIATNNYLYNGGDKMIFFKPNIKAVETEIKIRDIFIEEFKKLGNLPDIKEERLIIK